MTKHADVLSGPMARLKQENRDLADEVDLLRDDYAKIVHANAEVASLNVGLQMEVDRLREKHLQAVDFIDFKHRPLLTAAKVAEQHAAMSNEQRTLFEKAIAACEEKP